MLDDLPACCDGSELDRASLLLIFREFQAPSEAMAAQLREHVRPVTDLGLRCLGILRPDFTPAQARDHLDSILAQVFILQMSLPMLRLIHRDPDFPADVEGLARHITEFSLRGLGIPEAFPGAQA
jgi:hypothetical protein